MSVELRDASRWYGNVVAVNAITVELQPGITGLLNYRLDTALPIRNLTQLLLRGESTLTTAERELIASVVSYGNECKFCTTAHTATADLLLG